MKAFLWLLLAALIVLKVMKLIAFSWWIVFVPAYIMAASWILGILIAVILKLIIDVLDKK